MTIFLNVLFYNFLYFLGRGVFLLPNFITDRKKQIKDRILGFPVSTFYVVFGLIVLGNLGFILNFFIKLDSIIPIFFVTLPLVINLFYKLDIKDKTTKFITNIIIPSILSISSYNIGFHYDSGYYHLNFQNWLQKEKIVLGLSNIFQPFGLGSINDYISSLLWLDNNFILLHFVQLASIAAFYTFLVHLFIYSENLIDKVISVNILIFSILDNFGFGGGRNGFIYIQGVGKPDITFSIIFFIGFLLIFRLSSSEKIKSTDFLYLNWIVLFCFQLKVFGALLIIPYIYLLFVHKEKILKIIKQTRTFYIQVFVLISWSLKSLLLSGCIVFPVSQTCIENLNWFTPKLFNDFYIETKIFNKAFLVNDGFINWFTSWYAVVENRNILLNFITSFLIIYILNLLFLKRKIKISRENFYVYIFLTICFIALIFTSPLPRFLIPVFLITVSAINMSESFKIKGIKFLTHNNFKLMFLTLVLISNILLVPLNSHKSFIRSPIDSIKINLSEINYIENKHWGVGPENGDRCWINLECTNLEYINPRFSTVFGYIVIEEADK